MDSGFADNTIHFHHPRQLYLIGGSRLVKEQSVGVEESQIEIT